MNPRSVVSWSGGKDSAMALLRARRHGYQVDGLFTMFSPDNGTSRSHGLPPGFLAQQAAALGVPLHKGCAAWSDYEDEFKRRLGDLIDDGIEAAVFGDIFLDEHREWVERVCGEVGCRAVLPLWGESTAELAREVAAAGIEARVCMVRTGPLDAAMLGARLSVELIEDFERRGVDPCGEHGEYHTVVVAAPGCSRKIVVDRAEARLEEEYAHWRICSWHTEPTDSE